MPVLPASLLEPLWVQFAALLPDHARVAPSHPLRCHRGRSSDRLVFEHVLAALVHGSGYERIASSGCSDRTIRRRLQEWASLGLAEQVHRLTLEAISTRCFRYPTVQTKPSSLDGHSVPH